MKKQAFIKKETQRLVILLDEKTKSWHRRLPLNVQCSKGLLGLLCRIHFFNFKLWHEEDEARRRDVADSAIAQNKRNIDAFNQARNDAIERLDESMARCNESFLKAALAGNQPRARQNSETFGAMADRLSVISLKIHHMSQETRRKSATESHRRLCREKLRILLVQRNDLVHCFHEFWHEFLSGKRYFRVYRQMKMYNDPELNPKLYGQ